VLYVTSHSEAVDANAKDDESILFSQHEPYI